MDSDVPENMAFSQMKLSTDYDTRIVSKTIQSLGLYSLLNVCVNLMASQGDDVGVIQHYRRKLRRNEV